MVAGRRRFSEGEGTIRSDKRRGDAASNENDREESRAVRWKKNVYRVIRNDNVLLLCHAFFVIWFAFHSLFPTDYCRHVDCFPSFAGLIHNGVVKLMHGPLLIIDLRNNSDSCESISSRSFVTYIQRGRRVLFVAILSEMKHSIAPGAMHQIE
jgi:hypothetical protein